MKQLLLWVPVVGTVWGIKECLNEDNYGWPGTPLGVLHCAYQGVSTLLLAGWLLSKTI